MDTLPLEILQRIFRLACTDGGYTGCSLSLTSKAVRAVARTVRFHSVSLVAYPARLDSFVDLYARECDSTLGDAPRVEHLHLVIPPSMSPRRFICGGVLDTLPSPSVKPDSPRSPNITQLPPQPAAPAESVPPASASASPPDSGSRSGNQMPSSRPRPITSAPQPVESASPSAGDWHSSTNLPPESPHSGNTAALLSIPIPADSSSITPTTPPSGPTIIIPPSPTENEPQQILYSPQYREALHTLARLVAPHLETLVIQRGFRCQVRLLSPALAFIDTPFPRVRELALLGLSDAGELVVPHAAVAPLFPAATHLHLVRKGLAGHDCMDFWRVHAPRATHLRVSCLRAPFAKFVPSLAGSVGIAHFEDLPPPPSRTYPTLRVVVLHQDPPTLAEQERAGVLEAYTMLWQSLAHFKKACPAQGVKAVVVEPFYIHFEEWGEILRKDWLERMDGGPGCWKRLDHASSNTEVESTHAA